MRHLIDPLDFTQQEISTLLDLADRIHATRPRIRRWPGIKSWLPCSTSLPPAPASPLRQPC